MPCRHINADLLLITEKLNAIVDLTDFKVMLWTMRIYKPQRKQNPRVTEPVKGSR